MEILRHGPAHNQLLSPLTQYLALCGNFGAVSVQVPFEHAQFRARLRPLMYQESERLRQLQVRETGCDLRDILAKVPGLIAALAEARGAGQSGDPTSDDVNVRTTEAARIRGEDPQSMTHLELILSASELALLPFELAEAPAGFPGAGKPLVLQSQTPICLTRRVRSNDRPTAPWDRTPRILFAAANPGSTIPLQQHVNALVRSLQPWIDRSLVSERGETDVYKDQLTILPQATWESIDQTIGDAIDKPPHRPFTHVHILAHGGGYTEGGDPRFGIVLHDPANPEKADIVSGQRLALALRAQGKGGDSEFTCPSVVTIASCYGAQQRSVVGAGASVAHTLHESGIPLVLASQFPLTFEGSVHFTRLLYRGFLRGHDPRILIIRLRRELSGLFPNSHDWGGIVAYAALSRELEPQLRRLRYHQAKRSIAMAFDRYDTIIRDREASKPTAQDSKGDEIKRVEELLKWLDGSRRRLMQVEKESSGEQKSDVNGLLAGTRKKEAEIEFYRIFKVPADEQPVPADTPKDVLKHREAHMAPVWNALRDAREYYRGAFHADQHSTWALVQELAINLVLNDVCESRNLRLWKLAYHSSMWDRNDSDLNRRVSAHSNLVELYLQAKYLGAPFGTNSRKPEQRAKQHLTKLLGLANATHRELKSLRRQLQRYIKVFPVLQKEPGGRNSPFHKIKNLVEELLAVIAAGCGR